MVKPSRMTVPKIMMEGGPAVLRPSGELFIPSVPIEVFINGVNIAFCSNHRTGSKIRPPPKLFRKCLEIIIYGK
jgi:hypothetical protein